MADENEAYDCGVCGEPIAMDGIGCFAEDAGEFWDETKDITVIAHGQCGLDAGLRVA